MHYHDGKTPYTGATNYQDVDGLRTFTYVDHDKKTTIATPMSEDRGEDYRANLCAKLLALPASAAPLLFSDFTLRGEGQGEIQWQESMIRDPGLPITRLVELYTLTSNKWELYQSGRLT